MRILAITNLYPRPGHELVAPFNRQQFGALARNHKVRVIAPVPWLQALQDRSRHRLPAECYTNDDGVEVVHPIFYYPPRVMRSHSGQFYYRSIRRCVQRAMGEFQPDVLLACWAHPDGWAALRLACQAGLPVVIKVIGSDVLVVPRDVRRRACVSEALRQADRVVAVSRDLAEHVERLGVDRRRIDVVPEGIDSDVFTPGDQQAARGRLGLPLDRPSILFVGNLLLSKGAALLIEACRMLRDNERQRASPEGARARGREGVGEGFVCYFVGGGRDEDKLRTMIGRYGLADRVKLVGPRAHADLPDWYRASDVVALPSFSEGIPNVLREALECGRPFVATRVGGIPEISHPSYSRLIETGDAPALARALNEVLSAMPRVEPALVRSVNVSWQESADRLAESLAASGPERARNPIRPADVAKPTTRRLRVLAITNQYPRLGNDAIAAFNRQQFRELAGRVDLRVIAPLRWPEVLREWLSLDPRPRRFRNRDGVWVDTPSFVYPPKVFLDRHGPLLLRSIQSRVDRLLAEFQPDVLLGSWAYPDGWATLQLARRAGLPVVIKVHGSDVLVLRRHAGRRRQLAQALSQADRVVVVSADLAEHVALLGASERNIRLVPNGVDHELFPPGDRGAARAWLGLPQEDPLILFVGNILRSKGAEVLVEACRLLRERGRRPRCNLVGKGRDAGRVRALIRKYGLAEQVGLVGGCVQEHLPAWYQACDVVALPSFSEGSPNVLHEAIACGRPFVATQVGGIPELAHPSYSRLVPPGDADALADALDELLRAPPVVDAELVGRHTVNWQESAEQLLEVLQQASGIGIQGSAGLGGQRSEAGALVSAER